MVTKRVTRSFAISGPFRGNLGAIVGFLHAWSRPLENMLSGYQRFSSKLELAGHLEKMSEDLQEAVNLLKEEAKENRKG